MTHPSDTVNLQDRMQQFGETLRHAGIKQTHQRMEIYRALCQTDEHPDAETIYQRVRERIPTISLDTVYRALLLFVDLGVITSLKVPHERMRFDANMHRHHHFVCVVCGLVRDFSNPAFDALDIPDSARAFGLARSAQVEVRGVCWQCADQQETAPDDTESGSKEKTHD